MPTFLTIGYGDCEGYDRTPATLRDAAHRQDAVLQQRGAIIGVAGAPVQVRNTNAASVETGEGPFMQSALPVAGFAIIEAASIEEVIRLVSGTPCAVCHGIVEIWPLENPS
jgi:hypothetical protein